MSHFKFNVLAPAFAPDMSSAQWMAYMELRKQFDTGRTYTCLNREERETVRRLLQDLTPPLWELVFGSEVFENRDFAPNIHVHEVYTDGEVTSQKGSWAYGHRSVFTVVSGHPTKKCSGKTLRFSNVCHDGTTFMRTYDGVIAESMGRLIRDMIQQQDLQHIARKDIVNKKED